MAGQNWTTSISHGFNAGVLEHTIGQYYERDPDQRPPSRALHAYVGLYCRQYPDQTVVDNPEYCAPLSLAQLTTPKIDIPRSAKAPVATAKVWGGSETGYDFLRVHVLDLDAGTSTELKRLSGKSKILPEFFPEYPPEALRMPLPPSVIGHRIQLQFSFESDEIFQIGPGWYVDNVGVEEA